MPASKTHRQSPGAKETARFENRVILGAGTVALLLIVLIAAWYAYNVLLVLFSGVLFGIFLQALATLGTRYTRISYNWSLALVVLLLLVLTVGIGWALIPNLIEQGHEVSEKAPAAIKKLEDRAREAGLPLPAAASPEQWMKRKGEIWSRATGVFSTVLGALGNFLIILFVGIYLAGDPEAYLKGFCRLTPPRHRGKLNRILSRIATNLQAWIMGRMLAMLVIGSLTTLGLWVIGVRLALLLGILAGILNFIPYIGPVMSAVPAVLLAFLDGPEQALYVGLLYLFVQLLESYLLTPIIDRRAVSLPSALVIMTQVLLGALAGILGLALATPITAAIAVITDEVYVKEIQPEGGEKAEEEAEEPVPGEAED